MSLMNRLFARISGQPRTYRRRPLTRFATRTAQFEPLESRQLLTTLTVTNTKDSGDGSLRAEIAAAQSGDTIIFASTLSSSAALVNSVELSTAVKGHGHGKPSPPPPPPPSVPTITLTSGELHLTKNLTIQGPGAGQLKINASGSNERAFEVDQTAAVALSGLTISGTSSAWASYPAAAPWDGYGGGILNHGTLTVTACTVSGVIYGYNTEGGGIFNDGTLMLTGCTVSNCNAEGTATGGAGISNWGTATLTNTVISNNMADPGLLTYPWFNKAGGILNHGTMTLSGCTVSGNNARTGGGGIFNDGTLILNSSKVSGNSTNYGGGIYNAGTMSVQNASSITGNRAAYGGDVDNLGVLNLDGTSKIGTLDSVVGIFNPV
jgi:hypothetical protein